MNYLTAYCKVIIIMLQQNRKYFQLKRNIKVYNSCDNFPGHVLCCSLLSSDRKAQEYAGDFLKSVKNPGNKSSLNGSGIIKYINGSHFIILTPM